MYQYKKVCTCSYPSLQYQAVNDLSTMAERAAIFLSRPPMPPSFGRVAYFLSRNLSHKMIFTSNIKVFDLRLTTQNNID